MFKSVVTAVLCLGCLGLGGCAKLAHLEELLTLKGLSDEQAAQLRQVEKQKKDFDTLLAAIHQNQLGSYQTKESFRNTFGDPVYSTRIVKDGKSREHWLYRRGVSYEEKEKIDIYFDQDDHFVAYRHIAPDAATDKKL